MESQIGSVPNALTSHNRLETALLQVARSWEMPARRETDGVCAGTPHLLPLPNLAQPSCCQEKGSLAYQEDCRRERKEKRRSEALPSRTPANTSWASSCLPRHSRVQTVGLREPKPGQQDHCRAVLPQSPGPTTETWPRV